MKVDTIAEWIESESMAKAALGLGFRHGQGRWMGPPLAEIPVAQPVGKRKGVRESWG
jgi:EAL domain-containing protein (putative c-di-GMP-specific phosphodiesterase class I)